MSTDPATPPAGRAGCSACSGGENVTPGLSKSMHHYSNSSWKSRSLGRLSLDAVRSVRGTIKGRLALDTTTNQQPASPDTSVSAGSSPVDPPAKQRWYDSLRSRASQIPTPSSPSSMSSTLKRSRFFWSHDFPQQKGSVVPSGELQTQAFRTPLPKINLPSLQSELQTSAIFKSSYSSEKAACGNRLDSEDSASTNELHTLHKMSSETKLVKKVSIVDPGVDNSSDEDWRIRCSLFYKGSAWVQEHREVFPDACSAISHFAFQNMRGEYRWSNVMLWTGEIPYTCPRTKQTFTAYPHSDGPRRIEIEDKYCLEWAFIAFTDGKKPTRLPPVKSKDLSEEDERLMSALTQIRLMGYHVDVWTCRDSENWDFAMEYVREFGMDEYVAEKFKGSEYIERRERYEAFIQHGVAGFSQDDITLLDKIQSQDSQAKSGIESEEEYDYANDGYEYDDDDDDYEHISGPEPQPQPQPESKSDLNGILEHQETIAEDETKDHDETSGTLEISVDSEDLDMAARLAGSSFN